MNLLLRLGLMLALIGVGVGARRVGILTPRRTVRLNAFTFYIALPALIFNSTYGQRPGDLASIELLVGMWIAIGGTILLAWFVHRREPLDARRSVAMVQSFHSNFGFIGLPLVIAGLGATASGQAAVVLGIGALTQIPLTTIFLIRINGATADPRRELKRIVINPVILSLVLGLAVASVTWTPPTPATDGISLLSQAALPLALLCVGASLNVDMGDADPERVGSVLGLKVIAMPLIAFVALTALGASPTTVAAGVVMLGTPTAVSTYIYAGELGGDTSLASATILVTTIVGVTTLSGLLFLFG